MVDYDWIYSSASDLNQHLNCPSYLANLPFNPTLLPMMLR